MEDGIYDHSKKAGNEGDVIKHAFLLDTVDRLLAERNDNDAPFWYVDTHAARPFHRLSSSGRWTYGVAVGSRDAASAALYEALKIRTVPCGQWRLRRSNELESPANGACSMSLGHWHDP
jgi:hypothetical protein